MRIQDGYRLYFDGDSITDAGRDRNDYRSLSGYVRLVQDRLDAAGIRAECFNRGIAGNPSRYAGDEKAVAEIKPDVYSILIGINDAAQKYTANNPTDNATFEAQFRRILHTAARYARELIVIEPALFPSVPAKLNFYEDLDPKIHIMRKVAAEFRAAYIPLDGIFAALWIKNGPLLYSEDGVHPTEEGYRVIADAICEVFDGV